MNILKKSQKHPSQRPSQHTSQHPNRLRHFLSLAQRFFTHSWVGGFSIWLVALGLAIFSVLSLNSVPLTHQASTAVTQLNIVWRLLSGQSLHTDFSIHSFDFYYLSLERIAKLSDLNTQIFTTFQCVAMAVLSFLVFTLSWSRFSRTETFFLTVFSLIYLAGVQVPGLKFDMLSYAALPLKVGWMSLILLSVGFFRAQKSPTPVSFCFDGLILGAVFFFLLGIDIHFFTAGLGIVLLGLFLNKYLLKSPIFLGSFFFGWIGFLFIIQSTSQWSLGDLIWNQLHPFFTFRPEPTETIDKLIGSFYFILLTTFLSAMIYRERGPFFKDWMPFCLLLISGMAVFLSIDQKSEVPLFAVSPLFLFHSNSAPHKARFSRLILTLLFFFPICLDAIESHVYAHFLVKNMHSSMNLLALENSKIQGEPFSNWSVISSGGDCSTASYPERINSGVQFMKALPSVSQKLQVLDSSDPISLGLQVSPPRNAAVIESFHSDLDLSQFPTPELLFEHTDTILIPYCPEDQKLVQALVKSYQNYINKNYPIRYQNSYWAVFTKGNSN